MDCRSGGSVDTDKVFVAQKASVPVWLLGSMTLSGTLGIHIFAPALVVASRALGSSAAELQLGVSLYVWGLALGQLFHGPLSDRFGRRPILLWSTGVYTAASFIAAAAGSGGFFNLCRFMQALGGSAGMVIARTIVRDITTEEKSTGSLAKLNLMLLVGPGLGPMIGGFLVVAFGWQSIMALLGLAGIFNIVAISMFLPETGRPKSSSGRAVLTNYAKLLRSRRFMASAIGGGCVTTGWYAFLSAAPFVYQGGFHLTPDATGLHLGIVIAGAWVGSFIASRRSSHWKPLQMLAIGGRLSLCAALSLLAMYLAGLEHPVLVTAAMFAFTCGVGLAGPAALAMATSVDPAAFGSASGLYGCIQMIVGALAAAGAGFGPNKAMAAIAILIGCQSAAIGFFRKANRAAS